VQLNDSAKISESLATQQTQQMRTININVTTTKRWNKFTTTTRKESPSEPQLNSTVAISVMTSQSQRGKYVNIQRSRSSILKQRQLTVIGNVTTIRNQLSEHQQVSNRVAATVSTAEADDVTLLDVEPDGSKEIIVDSLNANNTDIVDINTKTVQLNSTGSIPGSNDRVASDRSNTTTDNYANLDNTVWVDLTVLATPSSKDFRQTNTTYQRTVTVVIPRVPQIISTSYEAGGIVNDNRNTTEFGLTDNTAREVSRRFPSTATSLTNSTGDFRNYEIHNGSGSTSNVSTLDSVSTRLRIQLPDMGDNVTRVELIGSFTQGEIKFSNETMKNRTVL